MGLRSAQVTDDATETGAGSLNLYVESSDKLYVVLKPGIEISRTVSIGDDVTVRPFASLGLQQHLADSSNLVSACLAGSGVGGAKIDLDNSIDPSAVDLGLGVAILASNSLAVDVGAGVLLSEHTTDYHAGVRLELKF